MSHTCNLYRFFFSAGIVVLLSLFSSVYGQLLNHSNGENSMFFTNPAAAGLNRRLSVNSIFHKSWTSSQSPISNGIAFHVPLHFERYGIGAVLFQESTNTSELLKMEGDFSTKIIFGRGYLSYGVRLGLSQVVSRLSEEKIKNTDDPLSSWRLVRPNVALGTVYKAKKYFAGMDLQLNHGLYNAGVTPYKTHVDGMLGAMLKTGDWEYQPVLAATFTRKIKLLAQSTHTVIWKRFVGLSAGVKSPGVFCPGVLLNALPLTGRDLQIRYTFEKMMRKNNLSYDQGHELQIRLLLRKSASVEAIKNMRTTPSPMDFQ